LKGKRLVRLMLKNLGTWDCASTLLSQKGDAVSKVSMMGTFSCQDGKADEMEAVLRRMVDAARSEPGVEIYSYHRGEGNNFSFFALMASQEAMQAHGQTDALRAVMAEFGPLMAGPPQMGCPNCRNRLRRLNPISSVDVWRSEAIR
jgi:quinol monooxygenase YgiN